MGVVESPSALAVSSVVVLARRLWRAPLIMRKLRCKKNGNFTQQVMVQKSRDASRKALSNSSQADRAPFRTSFQACAGVTYLVLLGTAPHPVLLPIPSSGGPIWPSLCPCGRDLFAQPGDCDIPLLASGVEHLGVSETVRNPAFLEFDATIDFRFAEEPVIDWGNETFGQILPGVADKYSPAHGSMIPGWAPDSKTRPAPTHKLG